MAGESATRSARKIRAESIRVACDGSHKQATNTLRLAAVSRAQLTTPTCHSLKRLPKGCVPGNLHVLAVHQHSHSTGERKRDEEGHIQQLVLPACMCLFVDDGWMCGVEGGGCGCMNKVSAEAAESRVCRSTLACGWWWTIKTPVFRQPPSCVRDWQYSNPSHPAL